MTAWLLLVCLAGSPFHGDPPLVGDQAKNAAPPVWIPIPTGHRGPENTFITEWTTAGPTVRFARRGADGVATETALGARGGVRTVTVAGVTDFTRTWVLKSAKDRTVGARVSVFLGNNWDGRLEIESSRAGGARVSAQLTYWRFAGVEYAVGFDTARGLVVRHGCSYDDDDVALCALGCCIRCLPWVEQFIATRAEIDAFLKRQR